MTKYMTVVLLTIAVIASLKIASQTYTPAKPDIVIAESNAPLPPNQITLDVKDNFGSVEGTVAKMNGECIFQASVELYDDSKSLFAQTRTDREGRYKFNDLPLDAYTIKVVAGEGFAARDRYVAGKELLDRLSKTLNVTFNKPNHQLDFVVARVPLIRGFVRNADGAPIPNALIRTSSFGARKIYASRHPLGPDVMTDASGAFSCSLKNRILLHEEIWIEAIHDEYERNIVKLEDFDWHRESYDVTIVLEGASSNLSVQVAEDRSIEPLANQELGVNEEKTIVARIKKNGASLDREMIKLSGTVYSAVTNKPILRASVAHGFNGNIRGSGSTVASGEFFFVVAKDCIQENATLTVVHKDYKTTKFPLRDFSNYEEIKLVVAPYDGSLVVNIDSRSEFGRLYVWLLDKDNRDTRKEGKIESDNQIVLRKINEEAGPFTVLVGNNKYYGIQENIDIQAEPTRCKAVTIPLKERGKGGVKLSYQARDRETGKPVVAARVELNFTTVDPEGRLTGNRLNTLTSEDGYFEFDNVPIGIATISLSHGLYRDNEVKIQVDRSMNQTSDIILMESNVKAP